MRSLTLRGRTVDRSFSVRFFDILVRSMVTVASAGATLLARLGFSDVGPLAIAVSPSVAVNGSRSRRFEPARLTPRPGRPLPLELGSELAGVASGQSAAAA